MNADVIRLLVYLEPSLTNSLVRSCKKFNRWILEEPNTLKYLAEHYVNKWESLIQDQLLRFFKPNKREIYKPIHNQNGMGAPFAGAPAYTPTLQIHLDYMLISQEYRGYGTPGSSKLELGWNMSGYSLPEYRDVSWFDTAMQNNSNRSAMYYINEVYSPKYAQSMERLYKKLYIDIDSLLHDILANLENLQSRNATTNDEPPPLMNYIPTQQLLPPQPVVENFQPTITPSQPVEQYDPDNDVYETWGEYKRRYDVTPFLLCVALALSGIYYILLKKGWAQSHHLSMVMGASFGVEFVGILLPFVQRFFGIRFKVMM